MSSVKNCLVFDLDGTISDPSSGIIRCYNHALQHHGYDTVDRGSLLKLIGPPLDAGFKTLVPTAGEEEIAGLVSAYRERYSAEGFSENEIYPGIVKALEQLKNCNVKMGICTSKRVDFAERILSLFEISDYFDFISGGDVGILKSAQLAELLSNGSIDHNTIMIGDRAIDISSARDNGLRGIGVLWGFGDYEELSDAKPMGILERRDELERIFT